MSITRFIALRYLLSRSRMGAVNWVSGLSAVAIAVVSMALVIVLSVYNGYVQLILQTTSMATPDLLIEPRYGHVYDWQDDPCLEEVLRSPDVVAYSPVLRTLGLVRHSSGETILEVVGVGEDYWRILPEDKLVLDGSVPSNPTEMLIGLSLANAGLSHSPLAEATLYVPKREGLINPLAPATAFRSTPVEVSGILNPIDEAHDRLAYLPIATLQNLLNYSPSTASALAIGLRSDADPSAVKKTLQSHISRDLRILERSEQHPELTFLIRTEKLMVFLIMSLILLLAAFNLASGLSMLIIEKRDDLTTLRALGLTTRSEGRIFALTGLLISFAGSLVGALLGLLVCWIQARFELIEAGNGLMTMPFPIDIKGRDLLLVLGCTAFVSCVISIVSLILFKNQAVRRKH